MKFRTFVMATLLTVLLVAGTASAQYREDGFLVTFNAGAVEATSEVTGEGISGNSAGLTFEKVLKDARFSAGVSIIWLWADEMVEINPGTSEKVTVSSVPFVMTARYNFLNSKFAANIGLGLGVHSSTIKRNEGTVTERSSTSTGFALSLPVTVAYFLAPDFYLQFIYTPSWMDGTPLRDDLAHSINVGIGSQW